MFVVSWDAAPFHCVIKYMHDSGIKRDVFFGYGLIRLRRRLQVFIVSARHPVMFESILTEQL